MISRAVVCPRAKIPRNIRASASEKALALSRTICLICSALGSPLSFRFPNKPRSGLAVLAGVGSVSLGGEATTSESFVAFVVSEFFFGELDLFFFNLCFAPISGNRDNPIAGNHTIKLKVGIQNENNYSTF